MITRENKIEYGIYTVFWLVIAMIPVGSGLLGDSFSWRGILAAWSRIAPFLVLFLVHQFLVAPYYFKPDRKALYFTMVGLLALVFAWYVFSKSGPGPENMPPLPPQDFRPGPPPSGGPHEADMRGDFQPIRPEVFKFLLGIAIMGMGLLVKVLFKSLEDSKKLESLEKKNLEQQLSYLRYQINPHFFMNTLHNIHALVDIDPEQAKESIVELSRLMRYILYEGDKPTIPLDKEIDFLGHYLSLMKMRYADTVSINATLPEASSDAEVPPLVFVSFVENAFKHGVSYESESYINITMALEGDKVLFRCANSRHVAEHTKGIGMDNVRERLTLLYGSDYTMHVDESADRYEIIVVIPIHPTAL